MSNPFIPVETAKPPKVNSPASLAEISHAFLEANDLVNRWLALCPQKYFCIGETGFGNALNFLSTWHAWLRYAPEEAILYYYSCEKHPLKAGDLKNYLEQWSEFDALAGELVKQYPVLTPGFHFLSLSNGRVRLILMLGEASSCFQQLLCSGDLKLDSNLECAQFDAWYLPGNSETLTQDLFKTIALLSRPGCTFAGFLEENAVKDNLHNCGFRINQQKQMPAGEFLEARYSASRRITAWHASVKREFKEKKAIIVGAGLAGAMTACALAKRGWEVRLIEQRASHAQGASGNSQAILYPQLSAFKSPLTDFMLMAYLYAVRFYQQIPSINDFADLSGILQVAYSGKERKLQSSLKNWLVLYPELASWINANEASLKAGIALSEGGYLSRLQAGLIYRNYAVLCCSIHKSKFTRTQRFPKSIMKTDNGLPTIYRLMYLYWQMGTRPANLLRRSGYP